MDCPPNNFLAVSKNLTSCTPCVPSYVPSSDLSYCAPTLVCLPSETPSSSSCSCQDCNTLMSSLICLMSVFTFVMTAIYVQRSSNNRASLLQFKIMANFFQVSNLTTLINIPLPDFLSIIIPFAIPSGSFSCLMSAFDFTWNLTTSFYLTLYLPLLALLYLDSLRKKHTPGSVLHVDRSQQLVVLVLLWYSPLLIHASSMLSCFEMDLGYGRTEFRLLADPNVKCDTWDTFTFERLLLLLHVFLVCTLVGLGLPFYIFKTTTNLRQNNELSADSDIASLFELYRPTIPHFEAFVLLRKCLLLLSSLSALTGDSTVLQVSTRLGLLHCARLGQCFWEWASESLGES